MVKACAVRWMLCCIFATRFVYQERKIEPLAEIGPRRPV